MSDCYKTKEWNVIKGYPNLFPGLLFLYVHMEGGLCTDASPHLSWTRSMVYGTSPEHLCHALLEQHRVVLQLLSSCWLLVCLFWSLFRASATSNMGLIKNPAMMEHSYSNVAELEKFSFFSFLFFPSTRPTHVQCAHPSFKFSLAGN